MRIVLVGRSIDRDRVRAELLDSGLEIVGETQTMAAARELRLSADALVLARPDGLSRSREREEDGGDDAEAGSRESLTPRELEVLALIAEGLPNKAIAERLAISDQTVKFHVAAIIGKLGAMNRTDAVRLALQRGLVMI